MMIDWMRFRKEISQIGDARLPRHGKMTLLDTISYPMISHIDSFRLTLFYLFVSSSHGTRVVRYYWCCLLWIAEVVERRTDDFGCLPVDE
jgi:hypothetical protein